MATLRNDKQRFFADLDGLDQITDNEEDVDRFGSPQKQRNEVQSSDVYVHRTITLASGPQASILAEEKVQCLARPIVVRSLVKQDAIIPDKSEKQSMQTSYTKPRSRVDSTGLFEGLNFYFLPNDDIAKVRRLRIQSAMSQGAKWSRKPDDTVTHIIVDTEIPAEAVSKALKCDINLRRWVIVTVSWLIECLSHKNLRDPTQHRFQLKNATPVFSGAQNIVAQFRTCPEKQEKPSDIDLESELVPGRGQSIKSIGRSELDDIVQRMKTSSGQSSSGDDLDFLRPASLPGDDQTCQEASFVSGRDLSLPQNNRGFVCMQPHNNKSENNPNHRTICILRKLATHYDRIGDCWRTNAYHKAISALRKQDKHIITKEQARAVYGIGNSISEEIEEIVATNHLRRLDSVTSDPHDIVLQLFMGIYGVGFSQATTWINQGHRTLEDLTTKVDLTNNQKVGIKHYYDFQKRIPREEVEKHGEIVQAALKRVDMRLEMTIAGSYRRGSPDSGDIDIMITHPTADIAQLRVMTFDKAIPYLFDIGFLKCTLAIARSGKRETLQTPPTRVSEKTSLANSCCDPYLEVSSNVQGDPSVDNESGSKFHGASCLPALSTETPPWRRIDLLLVPATSFGASLIYFTGNDIFNRSIRLLASRRGMRLNQHGLYKNVIRGPGRVKVTIGEFVEGRSERKIFEILGVPWRRAEERSC